MGQKVNPVGLRVGVNRTWDSRWFAGRGEYGRLLHEDMSMREHIMQQRRQAGIAKVVIERPHKKCRVTVHTARPGVLIGKKGADIEKLRGQLARFTDSEVHLNIVEIRKPEIDATLVAEAIAQQLERRVAFRRAMKRAVQSALRLGALGIRINVAGRLGGAEIARTEWYREGRVPLHTLRADIDFGYGIAKTAYGVIGIKVWIFKGEIMEHDPMASEKKNTELQESGGGGRRRDGDRDARAAIAIGAASAATARRASRRRRRREEGLRNRDDAATKAHEIPQGLQGPYPWQCQGRHRSELRLARPQGGGARARHCAPDRGRAARDHAPHEARRSRVDPHFPGPAGDEEAGRSAHGLGQGLARAVVRAREAGPHHVRARRGDGPDRARGAGAGCGQAADQDAHRDAHRLTRRFDG